MSNLTLDMYAKLLAHLACRRGARLEEILVELGIDATTFGHAEAALRADLRGAWPNRKGISAMKFATALGTELERLGALGGESLSSSVLRGDAPVPQLHTDAPPREHEVPTFLQAAAAPMPVVPIAPFAPIPAPAPAPIVSSPSVHIHSDVEPASNSPFAGTADMDLSAIVSAVKRGAVPFKSSESAGSSMAAESSRPTVELTSGAPQSGGTMNADLSAIVASVKRGALPFNSSDGSGPPSVTAPASEGDLPELPLETYASVTGALARGESREEALARHGLRADVFDKLAKAWAQRFQREPHLLAKFQELARSSAASPRRTE